MSGIFQVELATLYHASDVGLGLVPLVDLTASL